MSSTEYDEALAACEQNPLVNVFVAARLLEGGPHATGSMFAYEGLDEPGLCWVTANVVPINLDADSTDAIAHRIRRYRRRCSSIFGDAEQTLALWQRLEPYWGPARSVRHEQPLMMTTTPPREDGRVLDARVRPARLDELDLVLPASAHMFTAEIGYPPYLGSDHDYRRMVRGLIRAGRTYVITERGRVIFKADVGSLAFGVAQIQGVWVAPDRRGQGLAEPAMNAVVQHVMDYLAPTVTLYVNGFNQRAVRTYRATGFRQIGQFATVIL